jgi:hypothetical protein
MESLKYHGRQWPLWAYQSAGFADLPTGVATEVIDLPPNAVIVGGFSEISEAFNDGTAAVCNIGITGAATTFESAQAMGTLTNPAVEFAAGLLTNTGANGTAVIVTPTYTADDNTTGVLKIGVAYILPDRANENQPY